MHSDSLYDSQGIHVYVGILFVFSYLYRFYFLFAVTDVLLAWIFDEITESYAVSALVLGF